MSKNVGESSLDLQDALDEVTFDKGAPNETKFDADFRAARLRRLLDKIEQLYLFPIWFLAIAIFWLLGTYVVVLFKGIGLWGFDKLSDAIVLTMLGTALVKVFAPVLMFAKYLFKNGSTTDL